ncbi:MAG TPA: alanine--glyoxylate aminotransferase family protein [Acidimicrobiales bacterium]|nr:alanine--glyoxylate aminotransferase family protein [Acidimicrobiales bacterium]
MPLSDRVLMGPGPSNVYPEAALALERPLLGHLDPDFLEILDETCERLRRVFVTENPATLPISGTGSAGMEAAFVNFVGPGDVVVVAVNGLFGERMCDVARRCGAEVLRVDEPWGRPIDPERVLSAHPSPKVIAVVHAETSTGVANDVAALGPGKGDALLLADCVTSLGGSVVDVAGWGVDIVYSGTQKCLGVPPGLAPVTAGAHAMTRRIEDPRSWYLDLGMLAQYTGPASGSTPRRYHHTAPVTMIMSLHAGLGAILDEGLAAVVERHRLCGAALSEGLVKLGFELFAAEGHRLPHLVTVTWPEGLLPPGADEAAVRRRLLQEYGVEIGGGVGEWAGRMWRIGCMGHTARMRNVSLLLGALGEILGR